MFTKTRCQNPDKATNCQNTAQLRVLDGSLMVCRRCYQRFRNHGSGESLRSWEAVWRKKRKA